MSLAVVYSRASLGMDAPLVTVEVHLSSGMAGLNMVGLPATAVKESKDRVRSAIINSRFEFPIRRITINLAPADLPKEGGRFDLPIALGILAASGQIPKDQVIEHEFCGELALTGALRSVRGTLAAALSVYQVGRKLIVPHQNANEVALLPNASVYFAKHLLEVCAHLKKEQCLPYCVPIKTENPPRSEVDMSEVKGQAHAKRALEIAAAGRHSLLFLGPPGTGKTMLASRLPSILPSLTDQEALEVAAISSLSHHGFNPSSFKKIPFRSPHHTSSHAALVGGGRPPRPGEISLAHHGVLFLDELPEFSRQVLECLREPLESGSVTISRAAFQMHFPAQFQFIAAMNPCPCGYAGSHDDHCQCSSEQIRRYFSKLSGPLIDRIDMQVEVTRIKPSLMFQKDRPNEDSVTIKNRVLAAREIQIRRQSDCNSRLSVAQVDAYCRVEEKAQQLLQKMMVKFLFSARVYYRILKLAQTIADLENSHKINEAHLSEALSYRCLDRR